MGRSFVLPTLLGFLASINVQRASAQGTGTKWATIIGTDSFGADVYPEGYDGVVDPLNAEQECKSWCLSVATCTMFLYYLDDSGICYIKTGAPENVDYQIAGPTFPYNLVMRDMTCARANQLISPFIEPTDEVPQCIETTGNNEDEEDEVPRGALNEPCLEDGGCLNGNVCDVYTDGTSLCKSPMGGNCRDISDCSYTIADPRLECTLEGGSNDNRVCGIPTAVEPPAPSQAAAKRNRKMSDNSFECVNPNEELAHCGSCGNNCQSLPGVHELGVSCTQGNCAIHRCQKGYRLLDNTCVPKLGRQSAKKR